MIDIIKKSESTLSEERSEIIKNLRHEMSKCNIDAWIISSADAHNSEYVAPHWEGRAWLSGFTGSAGSVVITKDKAALWTDGRYFIQAEDQLAGSEIKLMKDGQPGTLSIPEWLAEEVGKEGVIGFDGATQSLSRVREFNTQLSSLKISLHTDHDLLDIIWKNRPEQPANPVFIHEEHYTGKTSQEKISEVREALKEKKATHLLVSTLDDIAWLFNLRGSDIECNPVFLAYALISHDQIVLFTNKDRFEPDALMALKKIEVEVVGYSNILEHLAVLPDNTELLLDPANISYKLASILPSKVNMIESPVPTTALKAIKNNTEIARMKDCHRRDGLAVARFSHWLEDNIQIGNLDEVNIDQKLLQFRSQSEYFKGVSFPSIVGYAAHGAICHYRADKESAYTIKSKGLLLIDSGGQYPDGTTDITRTFACGEMTKEEMKDYTLVLKSHIALATAKFKEGTRGIQLDAITRQPLWREGIDFNHGTGHGVGYFLNVHEGPQSISPKFRDIALKPGMLVTNEPGIYRDNKHGIRLENIMLVTEDIENEFGKFLKLTPMTLAPFDTKPLIRELMTTSEIQWLNEYHKMVLEELLPLMQDSEHDWLTRLTKAI